MKTEKEIKQETLEEVAEELFKLSKTYQNGDKREGIQDAYVHVVGMKNSITL
jgi:hypothetical protein